MTINIEKPLSTNQQVNRIKDINNAMREILAYCRKNLMSYRFKLRSYAVYLKVKATPGLGNNFASRL